MPPVKTPLGKKDGGIKLLDITEQPMGYGKDPKRPRKAQPGNFMAFHEPWDSGEYDT